MRTDRQQIADAFLKLVNIMDELREKCPWDNKQTIHTLRSMTIEETYELADAILEENYQDIKEELGDLMLHILFYAKIGSEKSAFSLVDVMTTIATKLIKRHPHIYGDVRVKDEEEVKLNWQKIKLQEGKKSVMSGVPKSLPAMVKAERIQEKAKQVGFEWKEADDVFLKIEEEMDELREATKKKSETEIEEEFGDVLFSLINYARFLQINAESALEKTNKKFLKRFALMEEMALEKQVSLTDLTLEEMDEMWNRIKQQRRDFD